MPTEYHLQKRGLAIWQYVTWYETYKGPGCQPVVKTV